jgi:hypothetical protein
MITRSDGSKQATYDGRPLYTYTAETAPGQANGNNLNLNGGLWPRGHDVRMNLHRIRAVQLGANVACGEREPELGATCLRIGSIPAKARP